MSETVTANADVEPLIIGRYALFDALASGGMATVHLGRLLGAEGFGRTVAVKRLHAQYTSDQEFVTMFMDEARIVARIRHPNVVPMVDVIESSKALFLVMEYVHGESFSRLLRTCRATKDQVPPKVVTAIMHGVLLGLHAAHETKDAGGELLDVVHRDVSPQNIIVGADGVARVLDFGVAKAAGRMQVTREGQIKGKLAYMAPEQIRGQVDRRADIFAAAVVLWEAIAGRRLHDGAKDIEIVTRVVKGEFERPSDIRPDLPPELDPIVMRGLETDPAKRYPTAREMALDLERKIGLASPSEVGEWVERLASEALRERADRVLAMEMAAANLAPVESVPPPGPYGPYDEDEGHSDPEMGIVDFAALQGDARRSLSGAFGGAESGFSNAGTPLGTEMPSYMAAPRQRNLAPMLVLFSVCIALAVVGAALGGFSLYARSNAAPATRPSVSSAAPAPSELPNVAPAQSADPSVTAPPPRASHAPPPRASHAPPPGASHAPPPGASHAPIAQEPARAVDAGTASTTTRRAPVTTQPAAAAQPQESANRPAPQPTARKNCDPPYTVDEQGHRKYKLECLGGD